MTNEQNITIKNVTRVGNLSYSVTQAAKKTSIGRNSLYEALNDGNLLGRKYNNRTVILHDDLIEFLKSLPLYEPKKCK